MGYKVRKGLETPLLLKGLTVRLFYVRIAIIAIMVLFLLGTLVAAAKSRSWVMALFAIIVFLLLLWGLSMFLRKKSKTVKFKFTKQESTITNRDIFNSL